MNFAMPVAGGVLIGIAAVWLYLSVGRIAGISGIAAKTPQKIEPTPLKAISMPTVELLNSAYSGNIIEVVTETKNSNPIIIRHRCTPLVWRVFIQNPEIIYPMEVIKPITETTMIRVRTSS